MEYFNKLKDTVSDGVTQAQGGSPLWIVIGLIVAIIGLYLLYFYGRKMIRNVNQFRKGSPYLLEETKDAKRRLVITQDPYKQGSINLPRSLNEQNGIESTSTFSKILSAESPITVIFRNSARPSPLKSNLT